MKQGEREREKERGREKVCVMCDGSGVLVHSLLLGPHNESSGLEVCVSVFR